MVSEQHDPTGRGPSESTANQDSRSSTTTAAYSAHANHLSLAQQRIIANELYLEIKEGRWKRSRATRTTSPGKLPPFRSVGAHKSVDSDMVRQRDIEILHDQRFIQILIPPEERFRFPPTAVQLHRAAYDNALQYLESHSIAGSWHKLLASAVRRPFLPGRNRRGRLTMRRNVLTPGVNDDSAQAATMILAYATIIFVSDDDYECFADAVNGFDYETVLASLEVAT